MSSTRASKYRILRAAQKFRFDFVFFPPEAKNIFIYRDYCCVTRSIFSKKKRLSTLQRRHLCKPTEKVKQKAVREKTRMCEKISSARTVTTEPKRRQCFLEERGEDYEIPGARNARPPWGWAAECPGTRTSNGGPPAHRRPYTVRACVEWDSLYCVPWRACVCSRIHACKCVPPAGHLDECVNLLTEAAKRNNNAERKTDKKCTILAY